MNIYCEPVTTDAVGCSQGYFKNNGYGSDITLGDLGIAGIYDPDTTLLQVISNPGNGKIQKGVQTYDGYIRQQVTAYLNSMYVTGFPLDRGTILAGGYTQGELEYANHGGADVICPFGS